MVAMNGADKGRKRVLLWRRRISQQRGSGLSVDAWCSLNDVGKQSFYLWRRRLTAEDTMDDGAADGPAGRVASLNGRHASALRCGSVRADGEASAPISLARVLVASGGAVGDDVAALRLRLSGGDELLLPASMSVDRLVELIAALERRAGCMGSHAQTPAARERR